MILSLKIVYKSSLSSLVILDTTTYKLEGSKQKSALKKKEKLKNEMNMYLDNGRDTRSMRRKSFRSRGNTRYSKKPEVRVG